MGTRRCVRDRGGGVAGFGDRAHELWDGGHGGIEVDSRAFSGEIDRREVDARHGGEGTLGAAHARCAVQAVQRQVDVFGGGERGGHRSLSIHTPGGYCRVRGMDHSEAIGGYAATKDELLKRLSRAEGQVRGVARMIEEDRYCMDVLTQISAARAALDRVALGVLDEHVRHCVVGGHGPGSEEERIDELMAAVGRLAGRRA